MKVLSYGEIAQAQYASDKYENPQRSLVYMAGDRRPETMYAAFY